MLGILLAMRIDFSKSAHILFFAGFLPGLSFFLSWTFFKLLPNPPFWLETLSPLVAYGLLYSLFEKYCWSWKIFRILGIVSFPDLRGRWRGKQRSSYQEKGVNVEVQSYLEISQTFSTIFVRAYYQKSQSESAVANFTEVNDESYLFYTYDNEPNSLKSGTMETHKGTVKLKYLPKESKLIGSYFNSFGNRGDVDFEFEQYDLIHRFAK
jgi:hypothetical protein